VSIRAGADALPGAEATALHSPMASQKPRNVVQSLVASGHHPVTHSTLFMGACEYGRAAAILAGYQFLPVVPFAQLVCQSIELGLKSYLAFSGVDEQGLMAIGHDLERAWTECCNNGLEVKFPPMWLPGLNCQYGNPAIYRYWRQGIGWSIPGLPKTAIETLHAALTQICAAIGDDGTQLAVMTRTPNVPWSSPT
jgi:hypothetical protein